MKYQPRYFVVKKGSKYLNGHDYASPAHIQYTFHWDKEIKEARRFSIFHSDADHFASQTNGKVVQINETIEMLTANVDHLIKITKEKADKEGLYSDAEITTEEYLDLLLDLKALMEQVK